MLKLVSVLFLLGLVLGLPTRTPDEVKDFKEFLQKTQSGEFSFEENLKNYPWSSAWENSGKYQGDIVLTDDDVEEMASLYAGNEPESRNAATNRNRLWPNAVLPFVFNGHNAAQQNQILGTMAIYEQHTCIRFRRRSNEHDFISITNRPDGCYAHVGRYAGMGAHIHNLAPNGCMHGGIIFHEFGHNVGFNHMHQARVRYDWVRINWGNIAQGMEHNFGLLPVAYSDMLQLPYEYDSNQHYGPTAFSRNGQPTIVATRAGGQNMGQIQYVTNADILRIRRLYGCAGAWEEEVRAEDLNKPAFYFPSEEETQKLGAEFAKEMDRRMAEEV